MSTSLPHVFTRRWWRRLHASAPMAGGRLFVNADAHAGELQVRITGEGRKALPGFDDADGQKFTGDHVAREITWHGTNLDALTGRIVRIEFFLKNADLYSFRAR